MICPVLLVMIVVVLIAAVIVLTLPARTLFFIVVVVIIAARQSRTNLLTLGEARIHRPIHCPVGYARRLLVDCGRVVQVIIIAYYSIWTRHF